MPHGTVRVRVRVGGTGADDGDAQHDSTVPVKTVQYGTTGGGPHRYSTRTSTVRER